MKVSSERLAGIEKASIFPESLSIIALKIYSDKSS